jgi:hypothetical protein
MKETNRPHTASTMNKPGPAVCSLPPAPMNRPVPIAPPMADHLQLSRFEALVVALILVGERRRVVLDSGSHRLTLGAEPGTRKMEAVKVRLHNDLA